AVAARRNPVRRRRARPGDRGRGRPVGLLRRRLHGLDAAVRGGGGGAVHAGVRADMAGGGGPAARLGPPGGRRRLPGHPPPAHPPPRRFTPFRLLFIGRGPSFSLRAFSWYGSPFRWGPSFGLHPCL